MRILVIDDSTIHRTSAEQTLVGHDVTIVGTYDEAHKLLRKPEASFEAMEAELKRRGFKSLYDQTASKEERDASRMEWERLKQELCPPPSFDVVLSDLLMPASRMTMGSEGMKFVGQEMPVGFALALMASQHGAKYVAVVTDTNHHNHPASAMLDSFQARNDVFFDINGAKVGFYHSPMILVEGSICSGCNGTADSAMCYCAENDTASPKPDCISCNGTGRVCRSCGKTGKQYGKDWEEVVTHLTM